MSTKKHEATSTKGRKNYIIIASFVNYTARPKVAFVPSHGRIMFG